MEQQSQLSTNPSGGESCEYLCRHMPVGGDHWFQRYQRPGSPLSQSALNYVLQWPCTQILKLSVSCKALIGTCLHLPDRVLQNELTFKYLCSPCTSVRHWEPIQFNSLQIFHLVNLMFPVWFRHGFQGQEKWLDDIKCLSVSQQRAGKQMNQEMLHWEFYTQCADYQL